MDSKRTKESIMRWKAKGVKVLMKAPAGYVKTKGASTAPSGYCWYNNNKSLFSGKRKSVLVKE